VTELSAQRVAENDAMFRRANERIARHVLCVGGAKLFPFVCECADINCAQAVLLTIDEYEHVRADATHFVCAPGHEKAAGQWAHVVASRRSYNVVEKVGKAAEIAEELDQRTLAT